MFCCANTPEILDKIPVIEKPSGPNTSKAFQPVSDSLLSNVSISSLNNELVITVTKGTNYVAAVVDVSAVLDVTIYEKSF